MKNSGNVRAIMCLLLFVSTSTASFAHGGDDPHTSIGLRAGWSGGPTGLSIRYQFAPHQALEFVTGYNNKEGRRTDFSPIRQGNYFAGITYQPHFISCEGDIGVGFYANMGVRARYHGYRNAEQQDRSRITPDLFTGLGMQVEICESVELFGDINVKYYNKANNAYVPGMESGAGIRVRLN